MLLRRIRRAMVFFAPLFFFATVAGLRSAGPQTPPDILVMKLATCDEADARPAIESWTRANELFNSHKYKDAIPLFDKVSFYFGNCARADDRNWIKYNHMHWQARADYFSAIASHRMNDNQAADAKIASARKLWLAVMAAKGTARDQDIKTAENSLANLDTQVSAWNRDRIDPRIDGPIGGGRRPPNDDPNCNSIVGQWRLTLPAKPRSYRTLSGLMNVRDLGGNDFEGIVTAPAWNFRLSFHDVRYSGPWKHDDMNGSASVEVSVTGNTAQMRGTLDGYPGPAEAKTQVVGYQTCGR
jgi:hypothetical protein